MLKRYGRKDLAATTDAYLSTFGEKFLYCAMSLGDIKVLLPAVYLLRSQGHTLNSLFKSPIHTPRWWSHLSSAMHVREGQHFMPITVYEQNFVKSFQSHNVKKSQNNSFDSMSPMVGEAPGGSEVYKIVADDKLVDYFGWTRTSDGVDYGWIFGTLLTSLHYTTQNLWCGAGSCATTRQ